MKPKAIYTILGLIAFFVPAVASYFLFSGGIFAKVSSPVPTIGTNGNIEFDQSLPKTEPCPLNGEKYSQQQKNWWEKHRPLGVMIENHENARPQSGLSSADVIYEAVAEGGITRFLAIYHCQAPSQVGPVRSARTYYLDFISEYGVYPLYAHVGGANTPGPANALGQIDDYGWEGYNDLNQFSIGFPTFWRDYNRLGHATATEHTMYSTTDKLWAYAKTRGLTNVDKDGDSWDQDYAPYQFKDDASANDRAKTQTLHLEFWSSDSRYFIDWKYDPQTNLYHRVNGGSPLMDRNNNKQLTTKNIVVLFMRESVANDGYDAGQHLLYGTKGKGSALILMDGKQIKGSWAKSGREGKTILTDSKGNEIELNRGKIWFEILPTDGVATVK
jgi:hypothetical protein